jgi:hypothetical protein
VDAVRSRLRIGRRFRGPPGVANGGFASGSLAAMLGGTVDVEVSLRRSVPLERPLGVRHDGDAVLLLDDDGGLLAEARPPAAEVELTVPDTPTPDASVGGPDGQVRDEVVWAALNGEVLAAARPSGSPPRAPLEDQVEHPTPWRGAHAHGDPVRHHPAHGPARRRARLRGLRPARGLGAGRDPAAHRGRVAHAPHQARLRDPLRLGPHPGHAGDDRRDPRPAVRRPVRARTRPQHQSTGGGVP